MQLDPWLFKKNEAVDYEPIYHVFYCPGLTCGMNIVKSRFLFQTVDPCCYILPIDIK